MASPTSELDEQIERLRKGGTLSENEVKALCEKVSLLHFSRQRERDSIVVKTWDTTRRRQNRNRIVVMMH